MKSKANIVIITILILLFAAAVSQFYVYAPDVGQPGGPVDGLSFVQLKKFYECREVFKKAFTVKEGLGPLYNADSCYSCHGAPVLVGNQGANPRKDTLTYIASPIIPERSSAKSINAETIRYQDSEFFLHNGGPIIVSKSITKEFPSIFSQGCSLNPGSVPKSCLFVSTRLAPALWGLGLIDAVPEEEIEDLELKQVDTPEIVGTAVELRDRPTGQDRVGRFGYKNQFTSLADVVADQMNIGLGLTSKHQKTIRTASVNYALPDCLQEHLPAEPNDNGAILAKLNYFLALAAPPQRGTVDDATNRGRTTFEKLGCANCHVPSLTTGPEYYLLDPDSQFPTKRYLRITALENREVHAYSDLLLHHMGKALADGIAEPGGVTGGQWRTAPLWGLRYRKYYLHDGRTTNLKEAILAHGGQGESAKEKFAQLPEIEKQDLLLFLKSL
jgi:CxxC motif-containing protein (DUF1111 family)